MIPRRHSNHTATFFVMQSDIGKNNPDLFDMFLLKSENMPSTKVWHDRSVVHEERHVCHAIIVGFFVLLPSHCNQTPRHTSVIFQNGRSFVLDLKFDGGISSIGTTMHLSNSDSCFPEALSNEKHFNTDATLGNLFQAQDGKRNKVTLTPCTDVTLCWANWMRETVAASNTSNLHPQQPLPTKAGPSADRNLSAWYPDNILGGQRDQASAVSNFWKWIRIFLVFSYSESSDELFATIFFPPGPPPCSIENNFPSFFLRGNAENSGGSDHRCSTTIWFLFGRWIWIPDCSNDNHLFSRSS